MSNVESILAASKTLSPTIRPYIKRACAELLRARHYRAMGNLAEARECMAIARAAYSIAVSR